jgi:hypothetical protein
MAQVLEFELAHAARPSDTPPHRRIRWASRVLSVLFGAVFLAETLFAALVAASFFVDIPGVIVSIGHSGMSLSFGALAAPRGYVTVTSLPLVHRLAHVAMGLVVVPPSLVILGNLHRLFRLYGRGVVFSAANARCLKWVGAGLAFNAIAPLISVSTLSALHMVVDHRWFHDDTIQQVVLGGVLYVIAQVMEVGRQIEEEQGQFV